MNPPLRALIADDEPLARLLIRDYLGSHGDIEIIAECANGLQAEQQIRISNPDLVFLDIQMPKLTGLEVLQLTGRRNGIIFTTAYDRYALKAFDLHAVDYLLKPFSQSRFDEALHKARTQLGKAQPALDQLMQADPILQRILIRDREQVHVLPVETIDYIEAQDDYIAISAQGKTYLKTQSMAETETQLNPQMFVRVHRSYIINLKSLQAIERQGRDGYAARMQSGKLIPISRGGYTRIRQVI
ncbi:MAG: LytR/AlgR family response regulator transcription factor [Iodobacter sp.]